MIGLARKRSVRAGSDGLHRLVRVVIDPVSPIAAAEVRQRKGMMAQPKARQQSRRSLRSARQDIGLVGAATTRLGRVRPSRAPEPADALVQLTAHRLLGHGYSRPAPRTLRIPYDARVEYSPRADRSVPIPRSVMRRATSPRSYIWPRFRPGWACPMPRAGLDRIAAGHTRPTPLRKGLEQRLQPQTRLSGPVVWRAGRARHLGTSPQRTRTPMPPWLGWPNLIFGDHPGTLPHLAMDVDRLASDCRWAAGRSEEALPISVRSQVAI